MGYVAPLKWGRTLIMSIGIHYVSPTAAADLDPGACPAEWRSEREIKGADAQASRACHRSGLCFFFEFEQVEEHGSWALVVCDDDISQSRLFELQGEMGEEAFNSFSLLLGRQAKMLWQEFCHGDLRLGRDPSPLDWTLYRSSRTCVDDGLVDGPRACFRLHEPPWHTG